MSRYPSEDIARFDRQFAETQEEREERQRARRERHLLEAASVALVAEFIGEITGLRPPIERETFPPHMELALRNFVDGMIQVVRECGDARCLGTQKDSPNGRPLSE